MIIKEWSRRTLLPSGYLLKLTQRDLISRKSREGQPVGFRGSNSQEKEFTLGNIKGAAKTNDKFRKKFFFFFKHRIFIPCIFLFFHILLFFPPFSPFISIVICFLLALSYCLYFPPVVLLLYVTNFTVSIQKKILSMF